MVSRVSIRVKVGSWFGLGGSVLEGKCPGGLSDTPHDRHAPVLPHTWYFYRATQKLDY